MAGSLRRNAVWQLMYTLFGTGTELLIVLVLAATLAPAQFGAFAVAISLSKLVFLLFEGRLHEFLTPKLSRYLGRSVSGVWMWTNWSLRAELLLNGCGFVACCAVAAVAPMLSSQFDSWMLLAAAAYNGANTFMKFSSLAILRCLGQMRVAAIVSMAGGVLKLLGLALLLHAGWSVAPLLLALATVAFGASVSQAALAFFRLKASAGPAPSRGGRSLRLRNRKAQQALLASNYATGLVEMMHRELDVQIAAWLAGPEEAGRYRLAKTLAMIMLEALNPVVLVLLPDLSRRLARDGREAVVVFLRRVSRVLAGISFVTAPVVVLAALGYFRWIAPQQNQALLPMLILVTMLTLLAPWLWCQAFLVAAGRPQAYLKASAVGAVLACACACALVPLAGAVGAVVAYGLGLMVTTMLAFVAARGMLKADPRGAA